MATPTPTHRPNGGRLLPPEPLIYPTELFKLICKEPDRDRRKIMLSEYAKKDEKHYKALRSIAELTWHPSIVWELPEGSPPYTAASPHIGQTPTSLFKVLREASRFLKGGGGFISNNLKREHYYTQMLESLSIQEAKLLIAIKDKNIESIYPYVRLDLFTELFPNWFPAEVVQKTVPFTENLEFQEEPEVPKEPPFRPDVEAYTYSYDRFADRGEREQAWRTAKKLGLRE